MNKLLKLLPFASGLLVFLGILKISVFFSYFEIPIMSYLSMSDILVLLFDDINLIIVVILIGSVHLIASDRVIEKVGIKRMDAVVLRFKYFYIVLFSIGLTVLLFFTFTEIIEINIWTIYLMIFLALQLMTHIFLKKVVNPETQEIEAELKNEKITKFISALILIAIIPLISYRDIREVKKNKKRISLYLNDGNKVSNSNQKYFLGKAGAYFFFYHKIDSKTLIIKNSEISKIIIKH
jgi:hypothetical protein